MHGSREKTERSVKWSLQVPFNAANLLPVIYHMDIIACMKILYYEVTAVSLEIAKVQ